MVIGVGVVEGGSVIVFLWQWGYLCSTGAFRDSGADAGAGAGLGNF